MRDSESLDNHSDARGTDVPVRTRTSNTVLLVYQPG